MAAAVAAAAAVAITVAAKAEAAAEVAVVAAAQVAVAAAVQAAAAGAAAAAAVGIVAAAVAAAATAVVAGNEEVERDPAKTIPHRAAAPAAPAPSQARLVTAFATGIATGIGTETETGIEIEKGNVIAQLVTIAIEIVTVIGTSTATEIVEIGITPAFTSHRITAVMAIAPTPMNAVTRMASTPAQTMAAGDKAMTPSVRTFTGMAILVSAPSSASGTPTGTLIATAFCVAMKRDFKTTKDTSAAGAFVDIDRILRETSAGK